MLKYLEFRNIEAKLNNSIEFLEMIKKLTIERGVTDTIQIIKSTGLLINQYPGRHKYQKLIDDVEKLIESWQDSKAIILWNEIKGQAEVINTLFQISYQSDEYLEAENIPREIEVEAFIAALEISLSSLLNEPLPLTNKFNFGHAFSKHDSISLAKAKLFDHFSNISGAILNYLIFHKKPKVTIQPDLRLIEGTIINSMNHITSYDKIYILKDIVDYWKYNQYKMKLTGKTIYFEAKNKTNYLANEISLSRFETRREKINIEIGHHHKEYAVHPINSEASELAPTQFIDTDEVMTFYSCMEYFYLDTFDQMISDVSLMEWIRALTILKIMCKKHKGNRKVDDPITLLSLCLVVDKKEIENHFTNHGIAKDNVIKIIDQLTFSTKDTDLFDTPLLRVNESQFVIVPSIVASMDITRVLMCNFLKKESNMDFKGYGFEKVIIADLLKQNIVAGGLNTKGLLVNGTERTFQCDLAFILGNDLFLCEIKAFSQPTTHRGFYELLKKKEEATVQLESISEFYSNNIHIVRSQLGLPEMWSPTKIYKLLIVTPPVGMCENINNTFVIDYSALSTFFERKKPGITALSARKQLEFNIYPELNGEITTEKLLKFLKKPRQVMFEKDRRRQCIKGITYGEFGVKIFDYETRFDDKISQEDESVKKYLLKVGKTVFKKKRKRKR
ncbi:hypothetical protein [Paenibacillus sp. 32352]|uniref:hypothetical protein n=1 Tax=Paenibacillus sp. 32352 TaxID=1969111 RepID=UPI0009ABED85|nr:hypothetical protein [Paenibacillus sp. 32352]